MAEMILLGAFKAEHITGKAWKEMGTQDGEHYVTYWVQFWNGRNETFSIHSNQTPELLTVLGQALASIRDRGPATTVKPEVREAPSSRK